MLHLLKGIHVIAIQKKKRNVRFFLLISSSSVPYSVGHDKRQIAAKVTTTDLMMLNWLP
jgi:hypothetical protein